MRFVTFYRGQKNVKISEESLMNKTPTEYMEQVFGTERAWRAMVRDTLEDRCDVLSEDFNGFLAEDAD